MVGQLRRVCRLLQVTIKLGWQSHQLARPTQTCSKPAGRLVEVGYSNGEWCHRRCCGRLCESFIVLPFSRFRATKANYDLVKESSDEFYQPTLDDVGARICCQWAPPAGPETGGMPSSFAEIGPLQLDPEVNREAKSCMAPGPARFELTNCADKAILRLTISTTSCDLAQMSGNAVCAAFNQNTGVVINLHKNPRIFKISARNPSTSALSPLPSMVVKAATCFERDVIALVLRVHFPRTHPTTAREGLSEGEDEREEADELATLEDFFGSDDEEEASVGTENQTGLLGDDAVNNRDHGDARSELTTEAELLLALDAANIQLSCIASVRLVTEAKSPNQDAYDGGSEQKSRSNATATEQEGAILEAAAPACRRVVADSSRKESGVDAPDGAMLHPDKVDHLPTNPVEAAAVGERKKKETAGSEALLTTEAESSCQTTEPIDRSEHPVVEEMHPSEATQLPSLETFPLSARLPSSQNNILDIFASSSSSTFVSPNTSPREEVPQETAATAAFNPASEESAEDSARSSVDPFATLLNIPVSTPPAQSTSIFLSADSSPFSSSPPSPSLKQPLPHVSPPDFPLSASSTIDPPLRKPEKKKKYQRQAEKAADENAQLRT